MIDITTLIAIVGALFTATAWVVNKLDKITSELVAMRALGALGCVAVGSDGLPTSTTGTSTNGTATVSWS